MTAEELSMQATPLETRMIASEEDILTFFTLADREFGPQPSPEEAIEFRDNVFSLTDFRPEQLRGVYAGDQFVAGCIVHERPMHVGIAHVPTACVGAVVTHPEHRLRGAGTALMLDTIAFAQENGLHQMLLHGIPRFYHRFGYADVFDLTIGEIAREAIQAEPQAEGIAVRAATLADAPDLLALYDRHFGGMTGSFVRDEAKQERLLQRRPAEHPIWMAAREQGRAVGYAILSRAAGSNDAVEVAADDWEATRALLHHHLARVQGEGPLAWHLPPDSRLHDLLIARLELPAVEPATLPAKRWAVLEHTYHLVRASWMARLVDLPALVRDLLPELQVRWLRWLARWEGRLRLVAGNETATLAIDGATIAQLHESEPGDPVAQFTPQNLMQLVYGFRTIDAIALDTGTSIPENLLPALRILFPAGNTWIPATDGF